MKKASEYHQRGKECRELAARCSKVEHRAALIAMAETWENLARNREAHVARLRRIEALTRSSWVPRYLRPRTF